MSLLDRYLDTEKYQGEIRPLPKALFYQRFGKHELWLTDLDADKAGIDTAKLKEQPDAQKAKRKFGKRNPVIKDGVVFKTPRLMIIRGAKYDDPVFWEDKREEEKGKIYGQVGVIPNLWEEWKNDPNKKEEPPFRKRRVILFFIVDANGVPIHGKPISLALHGGASLKFVERYQQFLEQLEAAFSKKYETKSAAAMSDLQAAASIWTPTFEAEEYGSDAGSSAITVAESWVIPTAKTLEDFYPKTEDDFKYIEETYESLPPALMYKRYFAACEDESKWHPLVAGALDSLKEGLKLPEGKENDPVIGKRNPDTGEISLVA
jgi:hypothetical protein